MAENKKSIIVYADWLEQFEYLTDDEAGKLIKHFFRYVNDLNPTAPDRFTEAQFIPIKQTLKRDLEKWEQTLEGRSKAGKASAEARRLAKLNEQKETNSTNVDFVQQSSTNPTDSVSVNDSVSVIKSIEERKVNFANSLQPYLPLYGRDMLNDFYGYWTEHGDKDKKFRSEKEKSFNIERRLETWKRNESKFGSSTNNQQGKL